MVLRQPVLRTVHLAAEGALEWQEGEGSAEREGTVCAYTWELHGLVKTEQPRAAFHLSHITVTLAWMNAHRQAHVGDTPSQVLCKEWISPRYELLWAFPERPSLAAAALVCKTWNVSFTPFLYNTIQWYRGCRGPTKDGIISNADHIHHLFLIADQANQTDQADLFSTHCTKLKSLALVVSKWGPRDWSQFAMLLQSNSMIRTIRMTDGRRESSRKGFLEKVLFCLNLRVLEIRASNLDTDCMELIIDNAIRVERLLIEARESTLPALLDKCPSFPVLKDLTLKTDFPDQLQFEIIRRSPGLRKLAWLIPERTSHQIPDVCDIFRTYCPLIECLHLMAGTTSDQQLSWIIDSCRKLTTFLDSDSMFGELAFRSLARHFATLQELNLGRCENVNSKMVQQIMTSCTGLILFYGTTLNASDILGDITDEDATEVETVVQEQPRDWVCTNLRFLTITICGLEGKPLAWHRRVMQQLARLNKLDTLSICASAIPPLASPAVRGGLDLRLEAGLGHLSSLKQLVALHFEGMWQQMEEQDVIWMIEAWPKLRRVMGEYSHPSLNASPQNAYPLLMHSIFRDGHRLLVINAFIEGRLYTMTGQSNRG